MARFTGRDLVCRRSDRAVFRGLGFTLDPGDALVLTGPNGSGKSSLLRLMAGLMQPDGGDIQWRGVSIATDREAHGGRCHYVGHADAIKAVLTVAESVGLSAELRGVNGNVGAALDWFGLLSLGDMPGKFLSAGQKRRAALARLLAAPAPLWLLDEPSLALDRASVAALEAAIARHRAGGGLAVIATHADLDLPGATELRVDDFKPVSAPAP